MRLIMKLAILFYTVIIFALVSLLGLFVLHLFSLDNVIFLAQTIYQDAQLRALTGGGALIIFLINWFFIEAISTKELREKNIAFDNPAGRVTVSLIAMEDLVRRICLQYVEVRDVRSVRIKAVKRGVDVRLNLALSSDIKIPSVTASLQEIIRHKIIETMWVKPAEPFVISTVASSEEQVTVRIDVTRIVSTEKRTSEPEQSLKSSLNSQEPSLPFQGYRA